MLRMELAGKRKRRRPKQRYIDVVRKDMAVAEVTEDDSDDRTNGKSAVATPDGRSRKKKNYNFACDKFIFIRRHDVCCVNFRLLLSNLLYCTIETNILFQSEKRFFSHLHRARLIAIKNQRLPLI